MKSLIYRVLPIILVIGNSLYGGGLTSISLPPTVYSEANFYYDADTVLYSNALVVKFSEEVIDLMKGDRLAELSDIDTSFTEILAAFNILDSDYGIEYIVKQVPDAMLGGHNSCSQDNWLIGHLKKPFPVIYHAI